MLLGFVHRNNNTGADISEYLSSKGEINPQKDINIGDEVYHNILIKNGFSNIRYQINNTHAIKNTTDPQNIWGILDINGIPFDPTIEDDYIRKYSILIFDWQTISIRQSAGGRGSKTRYIEEEQAKKAAELAKRAVYVLGLDYGMVKITVTSGKRLYLTAIDSSPQIRDKDLMVLFRKLDGVIQTVNEVGTREVKMGADPEFMLYNSRSGKMTPASQFFPRDGVVGCDALRSPNRQSRPIAELRPSPAYSPLKLLSNLEEALYTAHKMAPYKNIKWLAGSRPFQGYSIGGHIHFSNIELNNHVLRALDTYIGLPVFLIENQVTAVKRRAKYGFLADFRSKDYGGFEYRTPASWLVSPEIAAAVLCLAKIVTSNYLYLTRNCFQSIDAQRAFYEGNQEYLRTTFRDIWSDIQKLAMYQEFRSELQIIPEMIDNNHCWDEKEDIRKSWSITKPKVKKNTQLLFETVEDGSSPTEAVPVSARRFRNNSLDRIIPVSNHNWDRGDRYNNQATSGPLYMSTQNFYY